MAFIGNGEAARAFATATGWRGDARAYDVIVERSSVARLADALDAATLVLSLVTADQAAAAARAAAPLLAPGALYCDMNSVAPGTKRDAANVIEAAGGRYVDVAVMAPVYPAQLDVPLLFAGPHAAAAAVALTAAGFTDVALVPGEVGRASAIKMIRSVMVKGIEALTAEMLLAAEAAGVNAEVLASLGDDWAARAGYNIERMTTHGLRRAAEMEEVAKTLLSLGVDPVMTRGTILRQRTAGAAGTLQDAAA